MGSASEDEDDDDPHLRGQLGLGSMGPNGPDSVGPMGPSDLSVQSLSTDSKTTHDDSDQVCSIRPYRKYAGTDRMGSPALGFLGWRSGRTRRFASGEQESRRRRQRIEATRTAHDDKGETAGGAENGVQPDAEADTAHPRAAGQGDRSAHASDSGMFNIQMTPIHPRIRYQMVAYHLFFFFWESAYTNYEDDLWTVLGF